MFCMFVCKDLFVFKILLLLVEVFLDGLVYQVFGLLLNFQQMFVCCCCMEVVDLQCFVVELVNLGVLVCLILNWQGCDYWVLVCQCWLDCGDIVFKLIFGYVLVYELNLLLFMVIQEVVEECLVEIVGGWFGGCFGDIWLLMFYQGLLCYWENSYFVFILLFGVVCLV